MKRKMLALTLAGVMTLSGGLTVFAADSAAESTPESGSASAAESTSEELSEEDIAALLEALGGEEGEGLDLTGLIGELSDDAGADAAGMEEAIGQLVDSVTDENGNLNVGGLLEGLGLSSVVDSITGEEADNPISGILKGIGLGDLLGVFTTEDGSVDVGSILRGLGLGELISAYSDENGVFDMEAMINDIMGQFTDENGELDLSGVVGQLGVAEALDSITDETGSVDVFGKSLDLSGLEESLSGDVSIDGVIDSVVGEGGVLQQGLEIATDPQTWDNSGLLDEGSPVAAFLDTLGSEDGAVSEVVGSLKGEDGNYSAENILGAVYSLMDENAVQGDNLVINGKEISAEELGTSIKGAVESLIGVDLETLVSSIFAGDQAAAPAPAAESEEAVSEPAA